MRTTIFRVGPHMCIGLEVEDCSHVARAVADDVEAKEVAVDAAAGHRCAVQLLVVSACRLQQLHLARVWQTGVTHRPDNRTRQTAFMEMHVFTN